MRFKTYQDIPSEQLRGSPKGMSLYVMLQCRDTQTLCDLTRVLPLCPTSNSSCPRLFCSRHTGLRAVPWTCCTHSHPMAWIVALPSFWKASSCFFPSGHSFYVLLIFCCMTNYFKTLSSHLFFRLESQGQNGCVALAKGFAWDWSAALS